MPSSKNPHSTEETIRKMREAAEKPPPPQAPPNIKSDLQKLYQRFPFYPESKLSKIYAYCAHSLSDAMHLIAQYHTKDKIDPEHVEWILEKKHYVLNWCNRRLTVILDKLEDIWNKNGLVMTLDSSLEELLDLEATLAESLIQKMVREQSQHFMEQWIVQVDQDLIRTDVDEALQNQNISRQHATQIRTWIEQARAVLEHMMGVSDNHDHTLNLRVEVCYSKWMLWAGRRDQYVFERFGRLYKWGRQLKHEPSVGSALIYRAWFYCSYPQDFAQKSHTEWRRKERWTALLKEAFEWLHSGIELSSDTHERYLAYKILGDAHYKYTDLESVYDRSRAIGYYLQCLTLARIIKYERAQLYLLEKIALYYDRDACSVKDALQYYKQAIGLAQKFGDSQKEGALLNYIGTMYLELRQLKFAEDYLEDALKLMSEENGVEKAECYVNLARLHQRADEPEQAHVYYEKAKKIFKKLEMPLQHIRMLHRISDTLVLRKEYDESIKQYLRAIDLCLSSEDVEMEIETLSRMSVVFLKKNDSTKAIKCLERAQSLSIDLITKLEGTIPVKFMKQIEERCHQLKHIHFSQSAHYKALQLAEMIRKISKFHYQRHFDPQYSLDVNWLTKMHFPSSVHFMVYFSVYQDTIYIFLLCATVPIYHPYAPKIIHVERVDTTRVLGKSMNFEDLCSSLSDCCESLKAPQQQSLKVLSLLYQCLIQPIKSHLPSNSDQVIVFVPDPQMSLVPFSALYDMQNNVFLVEKHTIVVLPSIDAMHGLELKRKASVFVPEKKKKCRMVVMRCPKYRRAKYRFPYNEEKYAHFVDESTMVDGSGSLLMHADRCNIDDLKLMLSEYEPQLLHLSLRVSNDTEWPTMSYEHTGKIHFAETGIKDQIMKAHEFQFDFYNLEVLTLPICDKYAFNRSVHAFFSRQVRSVLGTLWRSADCAPVHEILIGFYKYICSADEVSKAAALRQSTLDYLSKHPSRRFDWNIWGGLQLSGDWHALDRPSWGNRSKQLCMDAFV